MHVPAPVCECVLIPGRTSSESELLGSSVGVSDVDTGKSRGRERGRIKEREQKRERGTAE